MRVKRHNMIIDVDEESVRSFANILWSENEKNPSRHWNGRQIRYAFQTAIAYANWEFGEMDPETRSSKPRLKARHFKRIAEASANFDDYIGSLYGLEDQDAFAVLAAREEVRKDSWPMKSKGDRFKTKRRPSRRGTYQDSSDEMEFNDSDSEDGHEQKAWDDDDNNDDDAYEGLREKYDKHELHTLVRRIAKLEKRRAK